MYAHVLRIFDQRNHREINMKALVIQLGPLGILSLVLLPMILKLTHTIAWSWWWVMSPFWIPIALTTFWVMGIGGIAVLFAWINHRRRSYGE